MCCHHKVPRDNHWTNRFLGERNHQTTHLKSKSFKTASNFFSPTPHSFRPSLGLLWAMFQLFSAKYQVNIHASNDTTILQFAATSPVPQLFKHHLPNHQHEHLALPQEIGRMEKQLKTKGPLMVWSTENLGVKWDIFTKLRGENTWERFWDLVSTQTRHDAQAWFSYIPYSRKDSGFHTTWYAAYSQKLEIYVRI